MLYIDFQAITQYFILLRESNWQMDISRFLNVEKWGILRENHVINLKMGKIEIECARFFGISKKNANAVTGQNPHSHAS